MTLNEAQIIGVLAEIFGSNHRGVQVGIGDDAAVVATGKDSITHYEVIEFYRGVSLVKVELETGRTHQIRVHFSALNHPLVGDTTYGADPVLAKSLEMRRPWLHAKELMFDHPITGEHLSFSAPYPADLTRSLALLSDAVLP